MTEKPLYCTVGQHRELVRYKILSCPKCGKATAPSPIIEAIMSNQPLINNSGDSENCKHLEFKEKNGAEGRT